MQDMGITSGKLHILDNVIEYWNDSSINFHFFSFVSARVVPIPHTYRIKAFTQDLSINKDLILLYSSISQGGVCVCVFIIMYLFPKLTATQILQCLRFHSNHPVSTERNK